MYWVKLTEKAFLRVRAEFYFVKKKIPTRATSQCIYCVKNKLNDSCTAGEDPAEWMITQKLFKLFL